MLFHSKKSPQNSAVLLLLLAASFLSVLLIASKSLQAKEKIDQSQINQDLTNDLLKVEKYLNGIKNLSANFTQESASGSVVKGKFYLVRDNDSAGKMRIEYVSKPKILVVVNGPILSYVDIELDEISRLSTNTTPASFLTRPNISFSAKDVEMVGLNKKDGVLTIALRKKNRREAGEFRLIFQLDPLKFLRMEVVNDLNQMIAVRLSDLDLESKIPDRLFVVKSEE